MRLAHETPAFPISAPSHPRSNGLKSPDRVHWTRGHKALLIERYNSDTQLFLEELNATTYCSPYLEESIDAGLHAMRQRFIDILFVALEQQMMPARIIVEQVRHRASELNIKCPFVFLLAKEAVSIDVMRECSDLGVTLMLRDYIAPVCFEAQQIFGLLDKRPLRSTVRIDYQYGDYTPYFGIGTAWAEIEAAYRLIKAIVTMGGGRKRFLLSTFAWPVANSSGVR